MIVGGIDRFKLDTSSVKTIGEILTIQQNLILAKAKALQETGTEEEKSNGKLAVEMIKQSRNLDSIKAAGDKILYPAEYTVRANALVEARRLVGGVKLEDVNH